MVKKNLFESMGLNKTHWGGAYIIDVISVDLNSKHSCSELLDAFCLEENLKPLGENWNELEFDNFKELLLYAMQFDIGFNARLLPTDKAEECVNYFLKDKDLINNRCFSNWYNNLWKDQELASNSISNHTLDLALAMLDSKKLLFIYFLFED